MLTSICYDVEDLITPESDDVALWIATALREAGIPATFFIVGEKARLYRERGREDVIEAMKAHEFGFHSTGHSLHPTTAELCEGKTFLDGLAALLQHESDGWHETEAILGRRLIGWATTGGSWCPEICGMMHQFGGVHLYSRACFGDHSIVWYGNCLNFGQLIGGIDTIFHSDAAFERGFSAFMERIEAALATNRGWLGLFGGHPTRIVSEEFWDLINFEDGAHPPRADWKPQRLIPEEERAQVAGRLREFARRLAADDRLEFHSIGDVAKAFDAQRPTARLVDLRVAAQRVLDEKRPLFTESFSAAELTILFANAILNDPEPDDLFARPTVFGPNTMPSDVGRVLLSATAIRRGAAEVVQTTIETGCLPPSVVLGDVTVSIGGLLYGFAALVREPERRNVEVPRIPPYPSLGDAIAEDAHASIRRWRIHPSALDTTAIQDAARLQTWTLKPAWHRDALPWPPVG